MHKRSCDMTQHGAVQERRKPPRYMYALPNLFTLAAMLTGFSSIILALNGSFAGASAAIFAAIALDSLDGRVARWTNTQSAFGEQMDSLSDMVSFGIAPALIAYQWSLRDLGLWGWIGAFVFCACAAMRLARFNTNTGASKRYFQGLPSPSGAAMIGCYVWALTEVGVARGGDLSGWLVWLTWEHLSWVMLVITLYAGITMISNVPFYSFKAPRSTGRIPYIPIIIILIVVVAVNINPAITLFFMSMVFGLSGYVTWAWRKLRGAPEDDDAEHPARPA